MARRLGFGGGWSLNASLATPVNATVIYYGNVKKTAEELAPLQSPVLMHYGLQDKWINTEMVKGFEAEAKKANKDVTVYAYDANHQFANPTGASFPYVKEAADLVWTRSSRSSRRTISAANLCAAHPPP